MKQLSNFAAIEETVSRETVEKLKIYQELLFKWNASINLVGKNTLMQSWERHFIDSLQLMTIIDHSSDHFLVDLGSGAGFPGMVLAITGKFKKVSLIEIDQRKSIFLKEVARQTGTEVDIINGDYKKITPQATIITARGLDKIYHICSFIQPLVGNSCYGLFLKGENYQEELKMLDTETYKLYPSVTSIKSKIIKIWFNR